MIPLGVLASRRESPPVALDFIGASATAFPTHAVGDLLIAVDYGAQDSLPGWSTAYFDGPLGLGVYYRFATVPNTAAPSLTGTTFGQGFFVYRGANATTPIGATAGAYDVFPALTLQDNSGSSWVFSGGFSVGGWPTSISGMVQRLTHSFGATYDTNGGVSSFTEKDVGAYSGFSIEIRGG